MASSADAPDTVTEAVALLQARGYTDALVLGPGGLACSACGCVVGLAALADVTIDEVHRFEGASDPEDEMIVLAVSCRACGARGVIVAAYGVDVDPDQAEALRLLAGSR